MSGLLHHLQNRKKQILLLFLFFLINFGLWEIIAPMVSDDWASFLVYVLLLIITLGLFWNELADEWKGFTCNQLTKKAFYFHLAIWSILNLLMGAILLYLAQALKLNILPENNENVKNQISNIPVFMAVIQGCVFAPIIEETVFRHAIIGNDTKGFCFYLSGMISVLLFDWIHVVRAPEFLYYLLPSVILTTFYMKYRNVFASITLHALINIVGYGLLILGML